MATFGLFSEENKTFSFSDNIVRVSLEDDDEDILGDEDDIEESSSSEEQEEESESFDNEEDIEKKEKEEDSSLLGPTASRANLEKELVYYIRITNFSQLANAERAEKHEQWEIKIDKTDLNVSDGKMRVRKVESSNGEIIYYVTVKNQTNEGNFESTSRISKAFFSQFKALSNYGMNKQRYTFPIKGTDLSWDIDVYPDGKGGWYSWARAELEYQNTKLEDAPSLPIEVEEVITPVDQQTEEGKAKVYSLFNEIFLIPNEISQELGETPKEESPTDEEVDEKLEEAAENAPKEEEDTEESEEDSDDQEEENDSESSDEDEEDDSEEEDEDSDEEIDSDFDEEDILGDDEDEDE